MTVCWLPMTKVSKNITSKHGNFTLSSKGQAKVICRKLKKMEKYESAENFYRDEAVDADLDGNEEGTDAHLQERTDMNLCVPMSGAMPSAKNEIAIDRMYADNNQAEGW